MGITTEKQIKSLVASDKKQSFGCGDGLRLKVESIKRHGGKYFEGEVNRCCRSMQEFIIFMI